MLFRSKGDPGRIDQYGAKGLLAKVYLTKSGIKGTRDTDDLAKAAQYAKDVPSHPFYTGKSTLVDTAGRVDKFMSRYGNRKK